MDGNMSNEKIAGYVYNLSRTDVINLLETANVQFDDDESSNELRESLIVNVQNGVVNLE